VKKILIISGTVTGLMLLLPVQSHAQQQPRSVPAKQTASDLKTTRDISKSYGAGARAPLADACTAWAEQNKKIVASARFWIGGKSHRVPRHGRRADGMRSTPPVEGKVGLAFAAPHLGDQQDVPERREFGADLPCTTSRNPARFLSWSNKQVIGAMGVSSGDG